MKFNPFGMGKDLMSQSSDNLLEHHGRDFEGYRKVTNFKFAFSFALIFNYLLFSYLQSSSPDLQLAIIVLAVPIIGFLLIQLSSNIKSLDRTIFYFKIFSITTLIAGANYVDNHTTGFQIRVVFLYAILYFAYLTDFLYIQKTRYYSFAVLGSLGVLLLPADFITKVMLFLAMLFMTMVAYDTVRLRERNTILTEELRQSSEDKIYQLSHFDTLTGLANRTFFNELAENYQQKDNWDNSQLAILAIGIDGFKTVNETLGHQQGDNALRTIASRISDHFTQQKSLISRHEGDHFTIALFEFSTIAEIELQAEKLLHAIAEPLKIDQETLSLTCSIGIALKEKSSDSYSLLTQQAETAMNEAKIRGRNRYLLYTPEMISNAKIRLRIENALRQAIKQTTGFSLVYQPKIDLESGKVCGAEALIRWHDRELGALSPPQFIPIAEDTGLIVPLGRWIYRQALHDIRQLQDENLNIPSISINLSARQFEDSNLLDMLLQGISDVGIDPKTIDLELTESVIMRYPQQSIKLLKRLREELITISIDDFGVAYSSLSYLKTLPANRLKIDKSFIDDIVLHQDDQAITSGIIEMGHNLGLKVLAEGVETAAQLDILKQLGCDEIQGFYYSKPLPLHEFSAYLKRNA